MKRIYAFDFIRGIAIILLIVLHTGLNEWTGTAALEGGTQESDPVINVLVFFVTQAGIYYTILGAVNGYMIYKRITSNRNSPKQIALAAIVMGVTLIIWNFIFRLLFSADSGVLYFLVGTGEIQPIPAEHAIMTSTISMLGNSTIIIGCTLALLLRKQGHEKSQRNYIILAIFGLFFLILAPFVREAFARIVETDIANGQYFRAILLSPWVYDNFPIFPYGGFSLMGAILGIALAREESPIKISLYCLIQGIIWFTIGMIGLSSLGGINPSNIYLNTTHALLEDNYRQYAQLGTVFFYFLAALLLFDFIPPEKQIKRTRYFKWLRRFGMISLTVYIFDSMFTASFRQVLNLIPFLSGWNESMFGVILFGTFLMIIWGFFAYLWEKINYKFTVEWSILKIIEKLSGKKSDKYDLSRINKSNNKNENNNNIEKKM